MREIREGGKTGGVDRIAVMAALNIANELLRERKTPPPARRAQRAKSGLTVRWRGVESNRCTPRSIR